MKSCCNPLKKPHSRRKPGHTQRISDEYLQWYQKLFPNFDWSGEKYLCTQCFFELQKQVKMLKVVAAGVQIAKQSAARKPTSGQIPPGPTGMPTLIQPGIPISLQSTGIAVPDPIGSVTPISAGPSRTITPVSAGPSRTATLVTPGPSRIRNVISPVTSRSASIMTPGPSRLTQIGISNSSGSSSTLTPGPSRSATIGTPESSGSPCIMISRPFRLPESGDPGPSRLYDPSAPSVLDWGTYTHALSSSERSGLSSSSSDGTAVTVVSRAESTSDSASSTGAASVAASGASVAASGASVAASGASVAASGASVAASGASVAASGATGSYMSSSSSSAVSREFASSPSSTLVSLDAVDRLNTTLEAMDVTPVRPSGSRSKFALKKTFQKAQLALKGTFESLTQKEYPISPDPKQKPCSFCNTLMTELTDRFPTLKSKVDKYRLLTSIPKRFSIHDIQQRIPTSKYMIKNASRLRNDEGAFSAPQYNYGHPLSQEISDLVKQFYLSSDNSRPSPRSDDVVYIKNADGQKERAAKHRILSNLNDLYNSFKNTYPAYKISESKFATLRPSNCVWPGRRGFHNTCVCEIHQNFEFMLHVLNEKETVPSFVEQVTCNPSTPECFNGLCVDCPKMEYLDRLFHEIADEEELEYMQWQHTDSTDIIKVVKTIGEFREGFQHYVPKIIEHDYVYRRQQEFLKTLKGQALHDKSGITIHVDFAQNYTFVVQNAVQGFHWSNRQATIHPFVVHWWCNEFQTLEFRTYCVISNELTHDADTFHAFRSEVLPKIRQDLPELDLQVVYYISDGAGSQYKNYKNFANLVHHEEEFGVKAEWHFTATAHGKSTCDAISGVVKSATRSESLKPGKYITTPEDMYKFCSEKLTSGTLTLMYVSKSKVDRYRSSLAQRYARYKTIPGTRRYHMFCPENSIMTMKLTSSSNLTTRYNFLLGEVTKFNFENLQIGSFYAFFSSANYQIGMVVDTNTDEGEAVVQAFKLNRRNGKMEYPNPLLFLEVPLRDLFGHVSDPITDDGVTYKFVENEFDAVKASYRTFRANQRK